MAIIFELWAECGDEAACAALVEHFASFECQLLSGRTLKWHASVDGSLATAATVWSPDLSRRGVRTVQDAIETTEAGLHVYHHLKSGPDFVFARAGWEAGAVPLSDLPEYLTSQPDGQCRLDVECALDDATYQRLGSPRFCYPFRPGYWWTRYSGETYRPLYSNDEEGLNERCRSLFPEYFKG
jgi:hypothetical protein